MSGICLECGMTLPHKPWEDGLLECLNRVVRQRDDLRELLGRVVDEVDDGTTPCAAVKEAEVLLGRRTPHDPNTKEDGR